MSSVDPTVIIRNFQTIGTIIQTGCILGGIALLMGGIFKLKRYGETRTFMSYHMTLAAPGMMIIGGVLLIALPTTLASTLYMFWSTSSPLHYNADTGGWDQYVPVIVVFVRLIGIGSIIRGIMMLSRSGNQGGQPGTIGKALIHIFGGILAVHVIGTVDLLKEILDITVY